MVVKRKKKQIPITYGINERDRGWLRDVDINLIVDTDSNIGGSIKEVVFPITKTVKEGESVYTNLNRREPCNPSLGRNSIPISFAKPKTGKKVGDNQNQSQ